MKNFIKGFRFTPSNYPAAVEDKIQKYRKQGYKLPPRKVLRTPEQLEGKREYLTSNAILFDTELVGPRKGEQVSSGPSYPYIVIKTEKRDESTIFE